MYDELWWLIWNVPTNVNKLTLYVKWKNIHAFAVNDCAWHVQTIKHEPWFLSKNIVHVAGMRT